MIDANFENALRFTLKWEGGYVNDPDDAGGETKYGITKRTLSRAYAERITDHDNIKELTQEDAARIYFELYWLGAHCEILPFPLCSVVFDCAVNCGCSKAAEFLWRTLNSCCGIVPAADGIADKSTRAAILQIESPFEAARFYNDLRAEHYRRLVQKTPRNKKYLRGWLNRVDDLNAYIAG